jgi:5-oxoprolinase (ATP-hydrolysing)/N-methylhydantoinase B
MNIIDATMVSICREMGIPLMKTSYSTIFNEGLDFTFARSPATSHPARTLSSCSIVPDGTPRAS